MFSFTEQEYKALYSEWRYDGRESVNEFVVKRFGDQFINAMHECVCKYFLKTTFEFSDFPELYANYIPAAQKFGGQDKYRIGITEFYYPSHMVRNPEAALAFAIKFNIYYQTNRELSVFRMEIFIPELNSWYFLDLEMDLRYLIEFYTEGLFVKKMYPLLVTRPEEFERNEIAISQFLAYQDALATVLYAQLGLFDTKEAIELMSSQNKDFWKPNVVSGMLQNHSNNIR